MQILHTVHQYLPEHVGGTELYTRTLAEYQARSGHTVAIFTVANASDRWPQATVENGVRIYRFPTGPRSRRQVFTDTFGQRDIQAAFSQVMARERPELVHIQHLMGLPSNLADPVVENGIPLVFTLHDYWFACANAQLITNYDQRICAGPDPTFLNCSRCAIARAGYSNAQPLSPLLIPLMAGRNRRLRQTLAQARRVICPTNFVYQTFQGLGYSTDRMVVIPHGIEPPANILRKQAERSDTHRLHIGYIGGISWQKGLHNLIAALNNLPALDFICDIYGDLSAFPNYVTQLQAARRHPEIHFRGAISHTDIWDKLATFDVFVHPALWYETSVLTIQEAFAAGTPVVASNIGAMAENIRDGVDGLLVPVGDVAALQEVLQRLGQDPDLLFQLRSGIKPVRTIADHVAEVGQLYENLLKKQTSS